MTVSKEDTILKLKESESNDFSIEKNGDHYLLMDKDCPLPVFMVINDNQILVYCNLFKDDEVLEQDRFKLVDIMHALNINLYLSTFSRIINQHIILGKLSVESEVSEIEKEIFVLLANAKDFLLQIEEYLL